MGNSQSLGLKPPSVSHHRSLSHARLTRGALDNSRKKKRNRNEHEWHPCRWKHGRYVAWSLRRGSYQDKLPNSRVLPASRSSFVPVNLPFPPTSQGQSLLPERQRSAQTLKIPPFQSLSWSMIDSAPPRLDRNGAQRVWRCGCWWQNGVALGGLTLSAASGSPVLCICCPKGSSGRPRGTYAAEDLYQKGTNKIDLSRRSLVVTRDLWANGGLCETRKICPLATQHPKADLQSTMSVIFLGDDAPGHHVWIIYTLTGNHSHRWVTHAEMNSLRLQNALCSYRSS